MTGKYDDIINLPRHKSQKRPPMPIANRAAQFSPFAALDGHNAAIEETARVTEDRVELDEYMKRTLDHKLQKLIKQTEGNSKIRITYFQPDSKKDGGKYITYIGTIKRIDKYERIIIMKDGTNIPIDEIIDLSLDQPCVDECMD